MCHFQNNAKPLPHLFPLSRPLTNHFDLPSFNFIGISRPTLQDKSLNEPELTIVLYEHTTSANYDNSYFPGWICHRASSSPLDALNTYIKIQTHSYCHRRRDFLQRWYPCTLSSFYIRLTFQGFPLSRWIIQPRQSKISQNNSKRKRFIWHFTLFISNYNLNILYIYRIPSQLYSHCESYPNT